MADIANRVVVYYQTQYDHSVPANTPYGYYVSPLPLATVITTLIVAAIHVQQVNGQNWLYTVTINDDPPWHPMYTQMWADFAVMQAKGIKILGMLGGAAVGSFGCLSGDNFQIFYPQLADVIRQFKLDGLDLDVEESIAQENIVRLVTKLKQDFGQGFIITFAPVASALMESSNLSGFDYISLEQQIGSQIAWYNAQFYSGFGNFYPDDMYIELVEYGPGIDPSKIVALTLTNPDNGYGFLPIDEVVSSVEALTIKYGKKFGGVAAWEYFNSLPDLDQPWQWATIMKNAIQHPTTRKRASRKPSSVFRRIEDTRGVEASDLHRASRAVTV